MEITTSVIRHLFFTLTIEYVSDIILMIQGHFESQKVNLKVTFAKTCFLSSTIMNKCRPNTPFLRDFE